MYHRTCYRNFTREYLSNSANSSKSQEKYSHEHNKGNFEDVKKFIFGNILVRNEAIWMSILQGIYSIGTNDAWYRSKLKKKKTAAFLDQLYFVAPKENTPEIVLSANKFSAFVAPTNENKILTAANIIKKDIL